MGEAEKYSRIINPFIFHLQKLELEIKCPVCLNLLSQPTQLPCNHVFCSHCILNVEDDLRCPLCNMSHVHQDLRPIPHLGNIVNIFRNMNSTFHMSDMQCSSNRLMNSNTADVTSQMDLMKNMNGEKYSRIINPLKFHLQKLELELKCPVCLNLLSQATSLPCNHAFCSHCILNIENDLRCLLCQMSHTRQDLRLMSRLQNIVSIFKNMNAIFHVSDTQWLSNRRTNSNTADVIPQMGLVNNRNGKRPRGRPKKRFLDNEPNQASVQPATDVKTVEKCKDGETCNRELNLLAQSQGNTPPLSNSKDSDDNDNNVGFTGYMVFANIILIDRLLITRLRKKRKRLDVVHKKCTTPKIQGSTRPPYSTQKGSSEMEVIIPFEQNADGNIDTTQTFTTSLVFDSRMEMVKWVKKVGRSIGVVIVVGRSEMSSCRRAPRILLICERGGKPDGRSNNRSTKKCDCPFKLLSLEHGGKWSLKVKCGIHNHALISNSGGHSFAGKLLEDEFEMLQRLTASGMRPRDILTHLKSKDPSNASSIRNIYNARTHVKKKMRVLETCDPTLTQS